MANVPGMCRCGTVMDMTVTGDIHCGHCDRATDCGGMGNCARHAAFERESKKLALETGP